MSSIIATFAAPYIHHGNILKPVAVVDWVSFIVRLEHTSHGGHLKRKYEAVGVSKVEPLNAGAGGAATEFRFTIQHPERYQVVQDLIDSLHDSHGLSAPPVLDGLEVSADFWPLSDDPAELVDLTKRLMLSITPPVIENPRLANNKKSVVLPMGKDVDPEMCLYVGNVKSDLLWRVYWKKTDETYIGEENKRLPKPLPKTEWRARAEVRIQGEALTKLGLTTPHDLEHFRFEQLHPLGYFKFCRHATGVAVLRSNIYVQAAAESLGIDEDSPACVLGMFARRDKRRRPRKLSRYLVTDTELTEAARGALRTLSRRF
jgi:hypothetical protein